MKVLVVGQSRTGTTALFLAKQAAMPPDTLALFEPATMIPLETWPSHILVKTLVANLPGDDRQSSWHAEDFDECYVLVRDPRDRLISLLLFLPQWSNRQYPPLWQAQPKGLDRYLALLRQKVTAPASLPTWALFERLMALRFGLPRGEALSTLEHLQQTFVHFHALLPDCDTVFYETLTQPIVDHVVQPPPRAYARILRRGTPGEWRQWFTSEDVDYFRPVFRSYLTWYGYDDEWSIPQEQSIRHATSTQYIKRWLKVDQQRMRHDTPIA